MSESDIGYSNVDNLIWKNVWKVGGTMVRCFVMDEGRQRQRWGVVMQMKEDDKVDVKGSQGKRVVMYQRSQLCWTTSIIRRLFAR
jgi:hypothetical protein